MKTKRAPLLALGLLMLAGVALLGCGGDLQSILGLVDLFLTPKFLIAVDASGAGNNVNVFPINATTGVLGSPVSGSPFDMGVFDGMTVVVHPNGHFVYVADGGDGSIHQWDVNTSTGVPTEIAPKVSNESLEFFEPIGGGDSPTHVLTVTPDGKFLYASNNDDRVSEFSIGTNGALSHIDDIDIGACATGAITSTTRFVWVTDTCGGDGPWRVYTMSIGSNGALSSVNNVELSDVFSWLWSISVSPDGKFVQVGDDGGDAQVYSFTVGTNGALTQVGSQVVLTDSSDARDIAYSPDGKFFYITDDASLIHALTQNADGSFTELGASPYDADDGQVVVDLTGKFVYNGGCDTCSGVFGFTRDTTTGALTAMPGSPFPSANDEVMGVGIVYAPK